MAGRLEGFYWLLALLPVFLGLTVVFAIVLVGGAPHGTDFYYHLKFAEKYANGEVAMFDSALMENNKGPYPPLFHLLLAPSAAVGLGVQFGALLELLLYPLAIAASLYFVFKARGLKVAAFAAAVLLGGVAFFDRTSQVTPQAIDMIFMPLAALAFFTNMEKLFLVSIAAMVYSHSPYSLLLLVPFVAYSWLEKHNWGYAVKAVAVSAPMALVSLWFLPGYFSGASAVNNMQEQLIRQNPLFFIAYVSPPLLITFVIALGYWFFKKNGVAEKIGFLEAGKLERFCMVWLGALLPLLWLFPDRFASYASQPMAFLAGSVLAGNMKREWKIVLALGLLVFFGVWYNQYSFLILALEGRLAPVP